MVMLTPHPDTTNSAATRIEVDAERLGEAGLSLHYRLYGDFARILIPEPADPQQADDLWRHTCFEAFVRPSYEAGYLELNFSPSLEWSAYRFTDYRDGMMRANVEPWSVEKVMDSDHLSFRVEIDPGRMARPDLPAPVWEIALSAVVEDIDGGLSYWALAHPPGKPDFHHPDAFALILPVPESA